MKLLNKKQDIKSYNKNKMKKQISKIKEKLIHEVEKK